MNAFMAALQTKSDELKPSINLSPVTPKLVAVPKAIEKEPISIEPAPSEPESEINPFEFLGSDFDAYRAEVDRLCLHYKCDKSDLAVIAVMHLARLIKK